jgi:hypothetical protein
VGTPIQDVFQLLGAPHKTVEKALSAELAKAQEEDGIFYKIVLPGNPLAPIPCRRRHFTAPRRDTSRR